MAVAVTLDIFGETEQQYEQVIAAVFPDGKLPDGWLVRLAGPTENGSPGATQLGETDSATGAPRRPRSSERSSSPSPAGTSCRSPDTASDRRRRNGAASRRRRSNS